MLLCQAGAFSVNHATTSFSVIHNGVIAVKPTLWLESGCIQVLQVAFLCMPYSRYPFTRFRRRHSDDPLKFWWGPRR